MGVDWFRYQLKPGVDKEHFSVLIEEQSQAFIDCGFLIDEELAAISGKPRWRSENSEALERYHTVCRTLRDLIKIDENNEHVCWRVYPITNCFAFPLDWRISAQRTYLPEEIPAVLSQWRSYAQRVLTGGYRAYLTRLYLFSEPITYRNFWDDLVRCAKLIQEKTNGWVMRPELKAVVARILAFPDLPLFPPPHWDEWKEHPNAATDEETEKQYHYWLKQSGDVFELFREWNRFVPRRWKLHTPYKHPYSLDDYLAQIAPGSWFDQFLEWADGCVEDKMGLWLDF